jgi:hypothetical protein
MCVIFRSMILSVQPQYFVCAHHSHSANDSADCRVSPCVIPTPPPTHTHTPLVLSVFLAVQLTGGGATRTCSTSLHLHHASRCCDSQPIGAVQMIKCW